MNTDAPNTQLIVKLAREELQDLIRQRVDITRRIGMLKQTIRGLCSLFGDDEQSDNDVREICRP